MVSHTNRRPLTHVSVSFLAGMLMLLGGCGQTNHSSVDLANLKEAWNANNDPALLRGQYEVKLASLPIAGETTNKPWTDTYWPSYRGGLADRWNDPSSGDGFSYPLYPATEVAALSSEALKLLSPAEKYDVFTGRYNYPLVTYERQRTHPTDPSWYGLCHGWAPAAINFQEPKPVVVRGPGGIDVPFGSSDIKALLMFAQQYGTDSRTVGERCNSENPDPSDPSCRDLNPGSFHVIIANQLGLLDTAFVAEINRGYQVWNQPVFGFDSQIISRSNQVYATAAPGTTEIAIVKTHMRYISEVGPNWEALPFAEFPYQESQTTYDYKLELNAAGEILGGEWISDSHPDFVWTQKAPVWSGFFADLQTIYEASIR